MRNKELYDTLTKQIELLEKISEHNLRAPEQVRANALAILEIVKFLAEC